MTHEELRDLYEFYALGLLEDDEQTEIDRHLKDGCETCQAGIRRAVSTNSAILALAPDITPPKHLRRRVLAAIGVEKHNWGLLIGWAALIAALLIATLWFSVDAQRTRSELARVRNQAGRAAVLSASKQSVLEFLGAAGTRQVSFSEPAPGSVLVNPSNGVLVVATNMAAPPPGQTYEMWLIPKRGTPKPAGLFEPDPDGNAVHVFRGPVDLADTTAVAISVEPDGGSRAPTGTPVITVPLGAGQ